MVVYEFKNPSTELFLLIHKLSHIDWDVRCLCRSIFGCRQLLFDEFSLTLLILVLVFFIEKFFAAEFAFSLDDFETLLIFAVVFSTTLARAF